jgi:FkbM family methyltransferase
MLPFSKYLRALYEPLFAHTWLFEPLRRMQLLPESIYKHLYFKAPFSVKTKEGGSFKMYNHGFYVETLLFWGGIDHGWEKESLKLWRLLSKDAKHIVDIGANTGIYSLLAAHTNPKASIHAFEPIERVFNKLEQNVRLNNFPIHLHQMACGNTDGEAIIYDSAASHNYMASMVANAHQNHDHSIQTSITVRQLDTLLADGTLPGIDLVKIDVEKFEPQVLEYLSQLRSYLPDMLIEILDDDIATAISKQLAGCEYLYFNIDEERGPVQVTTLSSSTTYNFLICKKATAKRLQLIS